jgi:hypothetical protein
LIGSTLAVLLILPSFFAIVQGRAGLRPLSLHPEDDRPSAAP